MDASTELVYGTRNSHGAVRYYKYYLDEGKVPEDWWADINSLQASSAERTGYPTQKPEALLQRIVGACSLPGDTVLDAYCGCGTTLIAAERAGRSWIGIDLAPQAISLTLERLQSTFGGEITERIAGGSMISSYLSPQCQPLAGRCGPPGAPECSTPATPPVRAMPIPPDTW